MFAKDREHAKSAGDAAISEMNRIDRLLSDYRDDSEAALVSNAAGGDPVSVSSDFLQALAASLAISRQTNGAFDVTIGPVTQLWRKAKDQNHAPSSDLIAAAHMLVNWRNVSLDESNSTVRLSKPGMRLDFGGIGKGFACDRALQVLHDRGIPAALVSIAGDIRLGEPPPNAPGWKIAIDDGLTEGITTLELSDCGISTSGDAEQFIILDGDRRSHIIQPREGLGIRERRSATVIARDATNADALATAITLLPPPEALALIESIGHASARVSRGTPPTVAHSSHFPRQNDSP